MAVPPLAPNVLLCDSIHRNRDTGKFYLIGAFNRLNFSTLPDVLASSQVFLSFTEVNGSYDVRVRIVHVNADEMPIHEVGGRLVGNLPLEIYEFTLPLVMVRFPEEGEYRIQILVDGEIIAERKLIVRKRNEGAGT